MSNRHFQRRIQSIDMDPMDDSSDNNSNHTWLHEGIDSLQLKRSEMNALIMDYLVHEGFKEAAERFREEARIEPSNLILGDELKITNDNDNLSCNDKSETMSTEPIVISNTNASSDSQNNRQNNNNNINHPSTGNSNSNNNNNNNNNNAWFSKVETMAMMDKRIEIRQLIEQGDILKVLSLINLYYPEMLDNHRLLYFRLQQQHLIELIRQQKINEVLSYVHDQLNVDELRDLTEMERTLALLAYENPLKSPYSNLLHTSHRLQLASEINDTILKETTGNVEATKPRLVTLLKLLFWTQSELEKKKIQFPKMTDLVNGTIVEPRH